MISEENDKLGIYQCHVFGIGQKAILDKAVNTSCLINKWGVEVLD